MKNQSMIFVLIIVIAIILTAVSLGLQRERVISSPAGQIIRYVSCDCATEQILCDIVTFKSCSTCCSDSGYGPPPIKVDQPIPTGDLLTPQPPRVLGS